MRFDPATARASLFPDGRYQAEITSTEERKSKKKHDMLVLTVRVFNGAEQHDLTDYIVAGIERPMQRLEGLCKAVGLNFDSGEIDLTLLVGKLVTVRIGTEKDNTGEYPDKNRIWAYMPEDENEPAPQSAEAVTATASSDDDIPF